MKHKVKKAITLVIKKIEKLLRSIYHKMPISHNFKVKAKNIFFSVFGCFLKNTPSYIIWKQTQVKKVVKKKINYAEFENLKLNKSIAVQLHLFYIDLLDEFMEYLNNIPYNFDLYISIINEKDKENVIEKTKYIRNVNKVLVKVVPNRGRDVAPLIVSFGNELQKYDYICHLHSKKSLYTGNEQAGWRRTLLEGLMGNPKQVVDIFYEFETNPEIGLIYPETWSGLPYWGHNWLSNTKSRDVLMEKLGFVDVYYDKYVDFPMGTMFWGRMDAISDFFRGKIKLNDFPEENGQVDGTIAHAFERCLGALNKINGYQVTTYDNETDTFSHGYGRKNLNQYWAKSAKMLKDEAYRYDIVSFDIFDTLLTRNIIAPDYLFRIIEIKLKQKDIDCQYAKLRKKAENNLRKKGEKVDFTIDEIYDEFQKITNYTKKSCDIIKELEVQTELEYIEPRAEMIQILKYVKEELHKTVILVSDMYLLKTNVIKLLEKCQITEYDELFISCECNLRKDNGTMWDMLVEKYKGKEILHIGDNEKSDAQLPGDRKISIHHIFTGRDVFLLSNIGRGYKKQEYCTIDSVALGIIVAKYFNNPYDFNDSKFNIKIGNEYDLGYCIIGPIVCDYMRWVAKKALENKNDKLLFLAREGYLFNNVFEVMKKNCPVLKDIQGEYLYASRRAMTVCNINTEEDIQDCLTIMYEGTLSKLMSSRFGIMLDNSIEDCKIFLPDDSAKVMNIIKPMIKDVISSSQRERENYLSYYGKVVSNSKRCATLDIGYAGTIQYFLSKFTKDTYDGYYFATDNKLLPLRIEGNTISGRYIEKDEIQPASSSYIHRYSLLLETVLTSMDNQFMFIDEKMVPHFRSEDSGISKDMIRKIHQGALDYANKLFDLLKNIAIIQESNKLVYEEIMRMSVEENLLTDELKDKFILEDNFCTDKEINVFKRLIKN